MKEVSESVARRLLTVSWLFMLLILTQIYTSSLTQLLTVDRNAILLSNSNFVKYNDEVRLQRFGRSYNTSSIMNHVEKTSRWFRDLIVVDSCPKDDWGYHDRKIADSVTYNGNKHCLARERDWNTCIYHAEKRVIVDVLKTCRRARRKTLQKPTSDVDTCLHTAVVYNTRETSVYLLRLEGGIKYVLVFEETSSSFYMKYFLDKRSVLQLVVISVILGLLTLVVYMLEKQSFVHSIYYILSHVIVRLILHVRSLFDNGKSHCLSSPLGSYQTLVHTTTAHEMVHESINPVKPPTLSTQTALEPKIHVSRQVLLLLATVIAMLTFQAALVFPSGVGKVDLVIFRLFMLFNSSCFIASLSLMMYLLHEFPLKPWPQVSVSTLFGAYMWLMKAISPREVLPVLFISIPVILMAATGKLLRFSFV